MRTFIKVFLVPSISTTSVPDQTHEVGPNGLIVYRDSNGKPWTCIMGELLDNNLLVPGSIALYAEGFECEANISGYSCVKEGKYVFLDAKAEAHDVYQGRYPTGPMIVVKMQAQNFDSLRTLYCEIVNGRLAHIDDSDSVSDFTSHRFGLSSRSHVVFGRRL
ncbi:MAG: hypothetical protein WCF94_04410 [bacterium]